MAVVRVIGCGNPDAGDDAAGILAVARARDALEAIAGVEVVPQAFPLAIVHLLEGAGAVVVVDAIRSPDGRRPPGALVRAEAGPQGLPAEIRSSLSSHGLGVAEAVGLAAALGPVPRVVVLGVEAGPGVGAGAPLSAGVEAGLPELVRLLLAEVESLAGEGSRPGPRPPEAERSPGEGPTGPSRVGSPERP